ncbi:hypothetical protein BDW42DRAFT_122146 [Aspergillus taichungensis]|uniref:DUF7728 domain-containing protein n=1 Tax=Aspergillus taichungensis TaxID=482145 RepID=A0A2J5HR69_9EURO|nr:hypothetical protein BDW42DRAFT_122146 [Aspergillus taichungensis]
MNLRSLLLGGTLALATNALLIVPEMMDDPAAAPGISALETLEAHAAQQQQVELHCTECPFREEDSSAVYWVTDGSETTLSLNFSVEKGVLLANDHQIFPPSSPSPLVAVQHRLSDGEKSAPIPLGYAVEVIPVPSAPEELMDLVAVRFTVLDLDGHPVPLNTVAMHLVHTPSGDLYIAKSEIEETTPDKMSWRQCRGRPSCLRRLLFSRMRSLFASAKSRMLSMARKPGCGGRRPAAGHRRPHDFAFPEALEADGHRRIDYGAWERTLSRVVRFILVPAVLGVLAGLVTSALGMLVGQLVVSLWRRHSRRSAPLDTEEQGTVPEKQGLMTASYEEQPPAYRDDEGLPEHVSADKQ